MQLSLWTLLTTSRKRSQPQAKSKASRPAARPPAQQATKRTIASSRPGVVTMEQRYIAMERAMLAHYGVRVRKWRGSTSGIAWMVLYRDGTVSKLIESPQPRGPMSAAVFLHEIGHHAIGLGRFKPRCLEEYYAWAFSFWQMREHKFSITDRLRKRAADALRYAVAKGLRRGLREVPAELVMLIGAADSGRYDLVEQLLIEAGQRVGADSQAA